VLHDKTVQSARFELAGTTIKLFNLHYFPYFLFERNMNEAEFAGSRASFLDQLKLEDKMPTVLVGDFNNGDDHLEVAYPELFDHGIISDAAHLDTSNLTIGMWVENISSITSCTQRGDSQFLTVPLSETHLIIAGCLPNCRYLIRP
jgi:hypothetical protein